jgi:hypothetical protein
VLCVASGPPTTTVLPRRLSSSISSRVAVCWAIIPPVKTMSAHSMSSSWSASTLQSTSRTGHDSGSIAATVIRPSGVAGYFAPATSHVAR